MKILSGFICLTACVILTACNDDVFIDKLDISTDRNVIAWDGGESAIAINGHAIDGAILTFYRIVDGKVYGMDDIPMDFTISRQLPEAVLKNHLFDLRLAMSEQGNCLKFDLNHNYYPDTVYIRARMQSEYESGETFIKVMPSPGFKHGDISYTLDSWSTRDRTYIAKAYGIINKSDETVNHIIYSKGQVVRPRYGFFAPWDVGLSENIFGRDADFKVPTVNFDKHYYNHTADGEAISYLSVMQAFYANPLICDEECSVEIPPNSTRHIIVRVKSKEQGFNYVLPAINPATNDTIFVDGVYWISEGEEFSISVE